MKKRILSVLICAAVIVSSFGGCAGTSGTESPSSESVGQTSSADTSSAPTESADSSFSTEDAPPAEDASDTEQTEEPDGWIVSDIKGRVTADMQIDPVDDFHAAVNQQWFATTEIPQGFTSMMPAADRMIEVREQVLELLTGETQTSPEAVLVQTLFDQYTDMDKRNGLGAEVIRPYIDDIMSIETIDDLRAYLTDSDRNILGVFVNIGASTDFYDSNKKSVFIEQPLLSLEDADEYRSMTSLGERKKTANETAYKKMLVLLGWTEEEAQKLNDDFFALECRIGEVSYGTSDKTQADFYSKIVNYVTPEELRELSPSFPIADLIKPYVDAGADSFILTSYEVLETLNELFVQENIDSLKAYMLRLVVTTASDVMSQEFLDIEDARKTEINGIDMTTDTVNAAYELCSNGLGWYVGKMYSEAYVTEETKRELEQLTDKIIAVYRKRLENNEWLSEETRAKAVEKLDSMRVNIAYPDDWTGYMLPDLEFKSYEEGGNLFESAMAIRAAKLSDNIRNANTPNDPDKWAATPQTVNAFYNPLNNSVNLPAGYLGGSLYSPDFSEERIMGIIGFVIGHEITHAFDSKGSQFDKDGNLADWWTDEDRAVFEERTAAVSEYFSQFEVLPGLYVNGELTKGETVADLGAISCMLEIAKDIEDFDYKLFFESYAVSWSRIRTEEVLEQAVRTDSHPPHYLRTNVIVQQFEEFYEAFGVEEGDGMYLAPEKRLSVW